MPVRLTIPGVLEDDELQPIIDQVVGREDDGPSERVVVVVGHGVGGQQRRVRVVWRRDPDEGEGEGVPVGEALEGVAGGG